MEFDRLKLTSHAMIRMDQRDISVEEIRLVLENGEIIEEYCDDTPFPSRLLLAAPLGRPLHVLAAFDQTTGTAIVVTVYEPDTARWEDDWKRRRRRT